MKTVEAKDATEWRRWLASHHKTESEIWLIFQKKHTARPCVSYEESVNEALCYGWIDSLIKRIDQDRYALKFTPRKADAAWSTLNRKRYAALKAANRLAPAGIERAPTDRSGDAPAVSGIPAYMKRGLKQHPRAWSFFDSLAPSHRRKYIIWVHSAKKKETRLRRLKQAIELLKAGHKPTITKE